MKKIKFLIGAGLALVMSGCVEEELETQPVVPPVSGDEVFFGANTGQLSTPQTKTVYGEPGDYENYDALTIKWQAGQDQVRVYSPEASTECQSADYTVQEQTIDGVTSYYLQKNGEIGVRWGDTNTDHNFYAFYPLNVDDNTGGTIPITGLENGTVVSANIPVAQDRGKIQTKENGGTTWKIVAPNMTYCMMAGTGTWTAGSDRNVSLSFKPIVLVLDVVITANDNMNYNVLGVSVRSKTQPIVGSFTYNIASDEFKYTSPSSDDNTLAYVDCQDNGEALELNPGEKLNVKFFLLPRDIKAGELTVSVLLENGQTLRQALVPGGGATDGDDLIHGQIIKVRTPKINPAQASNWMSMIGNDVLFASQLSMPGTKNSYTYLQYSSESGNYDANNGMMQTYQTLDISGQFNAGVRAFNVKVDAYNGIPHVYVAGSSLTNVTLGNLLSELKDKLDEVPTEFVVLSIDYVQDDNQYSFQEWLNTVCSAINTWSSSNLRTDNNSDGSTLNNEDTDYFREIVSTTTVGVMRHGIGVMIHCPAQGGDRPSYNSDHVNVIPNYSASVQNTRLVEYDITSTRGTGHVTIQNLQQMNNPEQNRYPYFITEQYALGSASSMDLIETKKDLISSLFTLSRDNNVTGGAQRTNNLYVNDLSGFCVVNDNSSTGFVTWDYYVYRGHVIGGSYWDEPLNIFDRSSGTVNNYADLPEGYAYYNKHDDEPDGTSGGWCRIDDENSQLGQGGNNALAAEQINGDAGDLIYNLVNEGRTPLGVVYMNFAGKDEVKFGSRTYNVSGIRLPSLIMSNNFKFALATDETRSGN